jgi:hypothetical protein
MGNGREGGGCERALRRFQRGAARKGGRRAGVVRAGALCRVLFPSLHVLTKQGAPTPRAIRQCL